MKMKAGGQEDVCRSPEQLHLWVANANPRAMQRYAIAAPCQLTNLRHWRAARTAAKHLPAPSALPPSALEPLLHLSALAAAPPPACFSAECQEAKDAVFLASLALPPLLLAAAAAWLLRGPPPDAANLFRDSSTGVIYEAPDGEQPELDRRGELAFRAVGNTPWPVAEGAPGERVRVGVGPVGAAQPRTFLFEKVLPPPSALVVATLPRPLGMVLEEDVRTRRVVVAALAPGGNADRRARRAALDPGSAAAAPAEGDVLRAVTSTNLVYPARALLGARPPTRTVVLFGCDGQRWPAVAAALKRGLVADGQVTVVLERPEAARQAAAAAAARTSGGAAPQ
jgi:hypothetical protein